MKNKKKAFTLTELLIVVIVIGILSAVVLPKFNKVVETRKTTEAEEVMAAIRTEQEKRCALNKVYTNDFTSFIENEDIKLAAVPNNPAQANSNNYTYTLTGPSIKATSKEKAYTLQMPSLADGRISCDGDYCSQLNKNYPTRAELMAKADYVSSALECSPAETCGDDALAGSTESCECTGTRSRTCNASTGEWEWGECVGGSTPQERYNQPFTPEGKGPADCGKRTERQICSNSAWTWENAEIIGQDTSGCEEVSEEEESCTQGERKYIDGSTCGCKGKGKKYIRCGSNGQWESEEYCTRQDCNCEGEEGTTKEENCSRPLEFNVPSGFACAKKTRSCNDGIWSQWSSCHYSTSCCEFSEDQEKRLNHQCWLYMPHAEITPGDVNMPTGNIGSDDEENPVFDDKMTFRNGQYMFSFQYTTNAGSCETFSGNPGQDYEFVGPYVLCKSDKNVVEGCNQYSRCP